MHFSTLSLALYASLAVAAIQPGRHFRERRQEDNGTISTTTEAAAIITEAPELLKGNNDAAVPVDNVPVVDIPVAQNETVVDNAAVVAPVANAEVVEPVANAEVIEPIAKGNTTVAPEVVAAVPIVTGEAPAPEVVAPIAVETTPAAALNGTLAPQTTLTVSVTEVETITSCAETVTDCAATAPGQAVVTTTIKVLTVRSSSGPPSQTDSPDCVPRCRNLIGKLGIDFVSLLGCRCDWYGYCHCTSYCGRHCVRDCCPRGDDAGAHLYLGCRRKDHRGDIYLYQHNLQGMLLL